MRALGGVGGVGPWVLHLTCCGFDDGDWRQPTWEEADALREAYVAAEGHDRSAVLTFDEASRFGSQGSAKLASDSAPSGRNERDQ